MQAGGSLQTLAEVSVALAGFASLLVVLRRGSVGSVSQGEGADAIEGRLDRHHGEATQQRDHRKGRGARRGPGHGCDRRERFRILRFDPCLKKKCEIKQ